MKNMTAEVIEEGDWMELRVLRYFLAVGPRGEYYGGGEFSSPDAATLSRQIKDLEEELGCQLLVRKSHRVVLTPEGMRLRKRAEEIIPWSTRRKRSFWPGKTQ